MVNSGITSRAALGLEKMNSKVDQADENLDRKFGQERNFTIV